jgi:hypothetical protein
MQRVKVAAEIQEGLPQQAGTGVDTIELESSLSSSISIINIIINQHHQ